MSRSVVLFLGFCLWSLVGVDGVVIAQDQKKDAPKQTQPKAPAVPDPRDLMAKPQSDMRAIVSWFDADRGNLTRFYSIPVSPTRIARLQRFYGNWLKALEKLNAEKMNEEGRADLKRLKERIEEERQQLASQARTQAEVAYLVPFAQTIIDLEESRRRMESMNAPSAASQLHGLKKQIDRMRLGVEGGLQAPKKDNAIFAPKATAGRAAETIASLRTALKNWFDFYNNYDPPFGWWMAEPYKAVDQSLQSYAALLKDKVAAVGESSASVGQGPAPVPLLPLKVASTDKHDSDVPELQELLTYSRSDLRAVIERYQADRGGGGRGRLASANIRPPAVSADRQAQSQKFLNDWLAALQKIEFEKLSLEGRIDYVLLRRHIEQELARQKLRPGDAPAGEGGERRSPRDESGITGRPIGREALLLDLVGEMIPYSPEELVVIANTEYAWCQAEICKASREMGFGDDWRKAVEKVKTMHVEPGKQPDVIRDLAWEATDYVQTHGLVTVPPIARETWRQEMMTPQRQLVSPFFTGGEVISVSFPTSTMAHEAKLQSMRGNNIPFARATVHHELIPGHHLQGYMASRYRTHRRSFGTPFWTEGGALYWEFVLYDKGFPKTPEDRVGFLVWRMHRCARIVFSLSFHLGTMTPQQCIDFLVERVAFERDNATAEVRRSFTGGYGPLYQAAYMLGGLQFRALRRELVDTGKMTERDFHDALLKENRIPIAMIRASLTKQPLTRDWTPNWKFYGEMTSAPPAKPIAARQTNGANQ